MNKKNAVITVAGIIIFCCLIYISVYAFKIVRLSKDAGEDNHSYDYHILVGALDSKSDFVKNFYGGAKYVASTYGGYAELLVPESYREEITLNDWMEYASYVNADGIILITGNSSFSSRKLFNAKGEEIPVIIAGECGSGSVQSVQVTASKYELGKITAAAIENGGWKKPVAFIRQNNLEDGCRIVSSVDRMMPDREAIEICRILSGEVMDDEIRQLLLNLSEKNEADLILCVSAEEANITSKIIVEQNLTGRFSVIGVYGDSRTIDYVAKGVVSAVIYIDPWEMGSVCASELFSWRTSGFANQYRNVNPRILKGGVQ